MFKWTKGKCRICGIELTPQNSKAYMHGTWCSIHFNTNKKTQRLKSREQKKSEKCYQKRLKLDIIKAYGGKCECCGEDKYEFLTIHHLFDDGKLHRREVGSVYSWIRQNDYPRDRFQLLCVNCNMAKQWYGYCPHERKRACP